MQPSFCVLAVALVGCQLDSRNYDGTSFRCEVAAPVCPEDFLCLAGSCREPALADSLHRLRLDNRGGTEDLIDFPLLLRLDASRVDYARAGEGGSGLSFLGDDGTPLAHEIDTWEDGGVSLVWVKVPRIASGATIGAIWMQYGAAIASDPSAVWSAGFTGVWHLNDRLSTAAPVVRDSSEHGNHGVPSPTAAAVSGATGFLGAAFDFDGVDDWVEVADHDSLQLAGQAVTLSAWISLTQKQLQDTGILVKSLRTIEGTDYYNCQLGVQERTVGNFRVLTTGGQSYLDGGTTLEIGRWYYLTGVYDGATSTIYIDGRPDAVDPRAGDMLPTAEPLLIGRRAVRDDRFFHGRIDEARVARVARSPAWIDAEVRSMRDQIVDYSGTRARSRE
jgi:Concanavalin A-like lectin/glucanases superfamily/Domain of unknown function (DUF2341)